jgi:hypothetical protein
MQTAQIFPDCQTVDMRCPQVFKMIFAPIGPLSDRNANKLFQVVPVGPAGIGRITFLGG